MRTNRTEKMVLLILIAIVLAAVGGPLRPPQSAAAADIDAQIEKKVARGIAKAAKSGYYLGVAPGIVTDNVDPEGQGRIKVRLPWLEDDSRFAEPWARLTLPMAGSGRGFFSIPEVDDEVLVVFEHGDIRHPYVLGTIWNGNDRPAGCLNSDGACACALNVCPAGGAQ